ncbi:MAG: ferric reductase-like transmembrane domain-containing protein [Actinomycetota bacterium]
MSSTPVAIPMRGSRPVRRPSAATVVVAVIYLGFAGVVILWWAGGAPPTSAASRLVDYGRLCGLVAAYLVLVQLALRARIPYVEHGVDTQRLARLHGTGGGCLVVLAVGHALLILWGYAGLADQRLVPQAQILVVSYPDVLMATAALGLLLLVGVVSMRAVRRRLRYETWFHLHLYVYLATALALSHQLANGEHFAASTAARWTWRGLYGVVAIAVLLYRVVTPLHRSIRHRLRVESVTEVAPGTTSVVITGRDLNRLGARPGQFFRWRFLTGKHWWSANPYSLSAPPAADRLRITAKAVGDHSRGLHTLRPGTSVIAEGPYGALTASRAHRPGVLLVAGGIGITPLRALLETLPAEPGQLTLIYRAHSAEAVVFRDELDTIAAARGASIHYLVGCRTEIGDPLTAATLLRFVPDVAERDVYLCGPSQMTAAVERQLRSIGVPQCQLHTETFVLHTV